MPLDRFTAMEGGCGSRVVRGGLVLQDAPQQQACSVANRASHVHRSAVSKDFPRYSTERSKRSTGSLAQVAEFQFNQVLEIVKQV
jgi:hypothetical protein